ncbi:hypothetical protein [Streptomyces sp. 1222.5]|uniref:hypothetical protein n=1 Tax=Streptomyces sp. 1222.5 TaxID=1881026 RepID=UPI003EBDF224
MKASRKIRSIALTGVGIATALSFSVAPAEANTSISAQLQMYKTATVSGANVQVKLPMSRYDAQGYINNGARIEVTCYGDDEYFDNQLFPTRVFNGTKPTTPTLLNYLWADDAGVHLFAAIEFPIGAEFNEDVFPDNGDEIYCKARWIDGDGASISAFTNVAKGTF